MAVYRFRVTFEDYDEVTRDIEIGYDQTFEDLHNAIQKSIGFDGKNMASFYMTNDTWKKGKEITLVDMSDDEDESKIPIMSKSVLCDFIEDPHQKIIYIFDFMAMWTFQVELIKIVQEEKGVKYPQCIKSVGVAPKQYKNIKAPGIDDEEDDEPKSKRKNKEKIFDAAEVFDEGGDDEDDEFGEESEEEDEFGTEYGGEYDDNIREDV
ncbi:MAG: hypothetical protein V4667_09880 [Bacteroidota bacterium]